MAILDCMELGYCITLRKAQDSQFPPIIIALQKGMIVDISHSGEQTFWDVIGESKKPVIASHSCVYNLCAHYRNLTDDQIRAIGNNGGVIFINFYRLCNIANS